MSISDAFNSSNLGWTDQLIEDTRWQVPGRFAQLEPIGKLVCKAYDTSLNEHVAIKKFPRAFDIDQRAKYVHREISLLKHVSHDNIIKLIDMFTPDSKHEALNDVYLVTDCMDQTLKSFIIDKKEANKTIDPLVIKNFTYQIFNGLRYLHSCNIMHRDLKPTNIIVNESQDLKIIDFGLSRTEQDIVTGYIATRWYRAPEIIFEWTHYTREIDLWSAGCVLAEMLTLRPLFQPRNVVEHLKMIFQLVGRPSDDYIATMYPLIKTSILKNQDVPIEQIPQESDFLSKLPEIKSYDNEYQKDAIDLLKNLLQLIPNNRISINSVLAHPYLSLFHDEQEEISHLNIQEYNNAYEDAKMPIEEWKKLIFKQIREYVPPPLMVIKSLISYNSKSKK